MIPGDMIEWFYARNNDVVVANEALWSSTLQRWVPIGSELVHVFVTKRDGVIFWFNSRGLFHARERDVAPRLSWTMVTDVFPRVVSDALVLPAGVKTRC